MRKQRTRALVFVLGLGILAACGGGGSGGTGTMSLALTDAPWPATDCLAAAWIVIDGVEARSDGGWVDVPLQGADGQGLVTLDLLDLQNGISTSLAAGDVPTGVYTEIRLHVVGSTLEFQVQEGQTDPPPPQTFTLPSGGASGLKLKLDPGVLVASGQTSGITIDVDVSESFHTTGVGGEPTCDDLISGAAGAIFAPVIRAAGENTVGLIAGTVTDDAAAPQSGVEVSAWPAGTVPDPAATPSAATLSSEEIPDPPMLLGSYVLALPPGTYDLYLRPQGSDEYQGAATDVPVAVGEITDQDLALAP
jgi:Domain of unknown function (DUF4382)